MIELFELLTIDLLQLCSFLFDQSAAVILTVIAMYHHRKQFCLLLIINRTNVTNICAHKLWE